MDDALYVHDNVEVRKTGRVATKTLSSGRVDRLVEITPTSAGSWKKWVRDDDLFIIEGGDEEHLEGT